MVKLFPIPLLSLFGCPKVLKTDRGSAFCSKAFKELEFAPAYAPEWMGIVERLNGVVRYALAKCCNGNCSDLEKFLPEIYFGIRAHIHGYFPFSVRFMELNQICLFVICLFSNLFRWMLSNLNYLCYQESVVHSLVLVRRLEKVKKFVVGEQVKLLSGAFRKSSVVDKKKPRYSGPYKIVKVYLMLCIKSITNMDSLLIVFTLRYYLPVMVLMCVIPIPHNAPRSSRLSHGRRFN
jgi:hypothetical protein